MTDSSLSLIKKGDALFATIDGKERAVRVLYARPVAAPGQDICVVEKKSKQELAHFPDIDAVPSDIRPLIETALANRYQVSTITAITAARVANGQRLITVETNQGQRQFNLKEPGKNITPIGSDGLLLRDSMGNRYRIKSLDALDPVSQNLLDQVT